jgi:hypothetical protein
MAISLTSPVTGTAQTGLTTPTYTVALDNNIGNNGRQWLVTALGGTQAGVTVHNAADPFTIAFFKPLAYKVAAFVSTSIFKKPPRNQYVIIGRKGVTVNTNFPKDIAIVKMTVDIPAGAEALDAANLRALMSALIGSLSQQSAGLGDTLIQNSL